MSEKTVLERTKTIDSVLGSDAVSFFPELPKVDKETLVGVAFVIDKVRLVDWDTNSGPGQFVLAKIVYAGDELATTLLGGKVVLKQVKKLIEKAGLPVACKLERKDGVNGQYFQLVSPDLNTDSASKSKKKSLKEEVEAELDPEDIPFG